jgi:hypothetical protein
MRVQSVKVDAKACLAAKPVDSCLPKSGTEAQTVLNQTAFHRKETLWK